MHLERSRGGRTMSVSTDRPRFEVEGHDWPNREASRFVEAGGLRWHVQEAGQGPVLLLLHGTGASTHSFRDLLPLLARHFHVIVPDLPGHGFTDMPTKAGLSLRGMAALVAALLRQIGARPQVAVGHSAGAAVLVAMAIGGLCRPDLIISINGAFLPMRGAGLLAPLAKLLFVNPLMPRLFAWRAESPNAVNRLLAGTGSRIDARGADLYARLFRHPGHCAGALGMMANWELDWLGAVLPSLDVPLCLIASTGDRAVPPQQAGVVAQRVTAAKLAPPIAGGHLVHEENPEKIASLILETSRAAGLAVDGKLG